MEDILKLKKHLKNKEQEMKKKQVVNANKEVKAAAVEK